MVRKSALEEVRREQILRAAFEVAVREGIGGVTVRRVATEAELSHSLVLFYFGRKDRLVDELLVWLIANSSVLHMPETIARVPGAMGRLCALLEHEMAEMAREPRHARLFLEYWVIGARHSTIRALVDAELERYHAAFRVIMEELVRAEPAAFVETNVDALSAVAVSSLYGCAVHASNAPVRWDTGKYLAAMRGLAGQLDRSR